MRINYIYTSTIASGIECTKLDNYVSACFSISAASLILNPPVDQTVPVNSTAVFSCRVNGFLVWEIDKRDIGSDNAPNLCSIRGVCVNGTLDDSPDETESVLLVAANENNGSRIRCLAFETIISLVEASKVAALITFGKLECCAYKRAVVKGFPSQVVLLHPLICSPHP